MSGFSGRGVGPLIIGRDIGTVVNLFTQLTGNTDDTIMGYINVPAGLMGLTGSIDVDASFLTTGANATWVYNLRIVAGTSAGTLAGTNLMGLTTSAGNRVRYNTKIANYNSLSSQRTGQFGPNSFTQSTNGFGTSAIDTSAAFTISVNVDLGSALDAVDLIHLRATLFPSL